MNLLRLLWLGGAPKVDMAQTLNESSNDSKHQDNGPTSSPKVDQHDATDGDGLQIYKMDSNPRGLGIIINNKNVTGKQTRNGAEEDGKTLQKLFEYLGFTTTLYEDLTAADMEQTLKGVAESDHTKHSCLLVAILSHGEEEEKVYGTDKTVSLIDLLKLFGGSKCESLISKPKIFIVQACRGAEFDEGVVASDGDSSDQEDETDSGGT